MSVNSGVTDVRLGPAEEAAARDVVDRVGRAWARHDGDAFADSYTKEATLILSGDRFLEGREAIRAVINHQFKAGHANTTLLQDIVNFRFISDGVAVAITEGGVLATGESKPAPERAIRATWVIAKQDDGEWLLAAYQNTRDADVSLPGA
jgi:uncharacterized protein (TIGR02246 family)